ncbi:hypothetical protein JW933_01255, partial [candidate division FCPU426 bacterium]|nr:hypothetical protein [candidate division FCPU426 bacterium]
MFRQVENLWQRYRHMHVLGRVAVKMGIALLFFISAPSGGRLLGPVAMLLFWIILSTETRTITFSSMILATVAGLMVFIPAATIMELPLILIFGKETMAAALACQSVEMLLIIAVLVLLNLSPRSRLRYTAGILDFVLVGLCLGVGLECGLGFLYPPAAGHGGRALGVLPQLPGLLGHQRLPVACASPAAWGMVYGLLAGISRYLIGPDFNGSWLRRGMVIGLAVVLWLWLLGERAGYIMGTTTGFWNVLHWIDLKGRLLSYSAGLLT